MSLARGLRIINLGDGVGIKRWSVKVFPKAAPRAMRWLLGATVALTMLGCAEYRPSQTAFYPPQTIFDPRSDFARMLVDDLFVWLLVAAGVVFVVVQGALFYTMFRFRRRDDRIPVQIHGNTRVEIVWTILPAIVLVFVAVPTVRTIFQTYHPSRENALVVEAIGHQWWFEFRYPGLNNIVTANEVHFPVGQRAVIQLESADVIHAFWIPGLGGKRDMVPTHINELWWTPDTPGIYYGQCTQLCGTSHANMRMRAIVHSQADWDDWVRSMQTASGQVAATGANPEVQRGYQLISTQACVGCHTIQGTPLQGKVGPNLTRFGSRTTLGAGMYDNTRENLIRWLKNPQEAKPGNKMPNLNLSDEDAGAIAAYLESLK